MDPRGNIYMDEADKIPADDQVRHERERQLAEELGGERLAKLEAAEARARIAFENPVSTPPLNFHQLRVQNVSRKARWHGEADEWSGADWSNAMAGECGEACNIIKKLRRHETHTGTTYNTPHVDDLLPALAEELADVVTYADLLADKYGIDLGAAVRAKFNRVSAAQDFPERL